MNPGAQIVTRHADYRLLLTLKTVKREFSMSRPNQLPNTARGPGVRKKTVTCKSVSCEPHDGCCSGGNYWTLFAPEIWKVLRAVFCSPMLVVVLKCCVMEAKVTSWVSNQRPRLRMTFSARYAERGGCTIGASVKSSLASRVEMQRPRGLCLAYRVKDYLYGTA